MRVHMAQGVDVEMLPSSGFGQAAMCTLLHRNPLPAMAYLTETAVC